LGALEKTINHLRLFKTTPSNGLVIFCGNISEKEGVSDIKIWSVEPPEPLAQKMYRCDQHFIVGPLKEMLREREVYGLIVLDAGSAEIGLLKGKKIERLKHLESVVPSKTVKGGMCLAPDTLVLIKKGEIIPIKDLSLDQKILSYDFIKLRQIFTNSFEKFERKVTNAYQIVTREPMTSIVATPEHKFFVVTKNGIEEKSVEEINVGDKLLYIRKVEVDVQTSGILKILQKSGVKKIEDVFQLFGYALGDGILDGNRIIFYDRDEHSVEYYSKLLKEIFGITPKIKKDGKIFEMRIYSKQIVDFFDKNFRELLLPGKKRDIPSVLLQSPLSYLRKFVRGLFDAEGYISKNTVRITLSSEVLMRKLQLLLLRLGIVSNLSKVDKLRYRLTISNPKEIEKFIKLIAFSFEEKVKKLKKIRIKMKASRVRRTPVDGRNLRKLIEDVGLNKQYFNESSMFLMGKRNMSLDVFRKRIIEKLKKWKHKLEKEGNFLLSKKTEGLINFLERLVDSRLILTTVKEKKRLKLKKSFYDLYIPAFNCFVANGLVVHNSQARYDRLREEEIMKFLKKVGETASDLFAHEQDLKGIIIGGPGPIKEKFYDGEYLQYQMQEKVLGIVDTSYTEEQGLFEIVRRGENLIHEASIIKERHLLNDFFKHLRKDDGLAVYGIKEVEKALDYGSVETLIISEDFNLLRINYSCSCGYSDEGIVNPKLMDNKMRKCPKCDSSMSIDNEVELAEYLMEKAKKIGTKVEIVSTDTREGAQFRELGGIGGILRYKMN